MVRTRIAPSPTGEDLHIGNLYTALFNWAWARKNGGEFIVRIEDTDQSRLVSGSEERILETLSMYGLTPHESPATGGPHHPYRQSERLDIYKEHAEKLIEKDAAYYCTCSAERLKKLREDQRAEKKIPRYDKHCRGKKISPEILQEGSYVIRLNVPENETVTFTDVVRGEITFNTADIDDQILIKSDGFPTYHMAVVIDDKLMNITHIIRGEEWISSTPKHILLYHAFGWDLPTFVHMPILRNPDKSKLSKRKNPVWAKWYLDEGYFPEAVLNYLALMGFSHPEGKELFDLNEFVEVIDFSRIAAVGPVFDVVKLSWMNGEYIRAMSAENLQSAIFDFHKGKYSEDLIKKTIPLIQERIKTIKEYDEYCDFFINRPQKHVGAIFKSPDQGAVSKSPEQTKHILLSTSTALEKIETWNTEKIGEVMQAVATETGTKNSEYFMIMRIVITGRKISPPLNESMEILGREECLVRIADQLGWIS